jgi:hypothetical protein
VRSSNVCHAVASDHCASRAPHPEGLKSPTLPPCQLAIHLQRIHSVLHLTPLPQSGRRQCSSFSVPQMMKHNLLPNWCSWCGACAVLANTAPRIFGGNWGGGVRRGGELFQQPTWNAFLLVALCTTCGCTRQAEGPAPTCYHRVCSTTYCSSNAAVQYVPCWAMQPLAYWGGGCLCGPGQGGGAQLTLTFYCYFGYFSRWTSCFTLDERGRRWHSTS